MKNISNYIIMPICLLVIGSTLSASGQCCQQLDYKQEHYIAKQYLQEADNNESCAKNCGLIGNLSRLTCKTKVLAQTWNGNCNKQCLQVHAPCIEPAAENICCCIVVCPIALCITGSTSNNLQPQIMKR